MSDKKEKVSEKLERSIKAFDFFGEGISFEIDGKSTYRSYLGTFLSLSVIVITISYAFSRYRILMDYGDTVHL